MAPLILNLGTRWRWVVAVPVGKNYDTYWVGGWVGLLKKRSLLIKCGK